MNITAQGYSNGNLVVTKTFSIDPKTKVVDYFDSFFNLNNFTDIDTVVFSSDFPALTGIVISGKENNKLLFSPCKNTKPFQIINITRQYESYIHQTNFVFIAGDYFSVIYHGGKNYLKRIVGDAQSGFDKLELGGDLWAISLVKATEENKLIILGTDNSNYFIARKIDLAGNTIWETRLGNYNSNLFDPDIMNIVGGTTGGRLIVAFHDYNLNKGRIMAIDELDGSIVKTTDFTSTGKFYKAFASGDNVGIACAYMSNNKYYLQFMFFDNSGTLVKHIYGESPVSPDTENVIYDTFQNGDNIFCFLGTKINDGSDTIYWYYSTYIMIIPYSNSDFSNPLTLAPVGLFLRKGSTAFSAITPAFEDGYDFTWVLYTSPFYLAINSSSLIINLKERSGGGYSAYILIRDLPYNIISAYGEPLGFIVTTVQYERVGDNLTTLYTVVDKDLFGYNMYNY